MAIDDYGGGWAVPTMETSLEIGRLAAERAVLKDILRKEHGGARGAAAPASSRQRSHRAGPRPGRRSTPASAIKPRLSGRRMPISSAPSKSGQPEAVPEYRRLFATANLPAGFEDVLRPYGLRADDAADALTAYWVMAWAVAHRIADDSDLPSPQAVAGVRRQVGQGFALTPVGRYDQTRRQLLADEAIFNFLVLNGAWRSARHDPAQFDRLAAATQRNFLALGADLGRLAIGPGGFVQR